MQAYPRLRRLAVLAARDAGKSTREVALKYTVSESWVRRVVQQRRELGKLGPYRYRRRNRHTGPLICRVMDMVMEDPRITVKELERVLRTKLSLQLVSSVKQGLDISHQIIWYGGLDLELSLSPTGNVTVSMTRFLLPCDLEWDLEILNREV